MKKKLLVFCLLLALIVVQAQSYLDLFLNANYFARRTVVERGGSNRIRVELVYKWGKDKIVQVLSPVLLIWARRFDTFVIGQPNDIRISPLEILDLEDLLIRALKQYGVSKVEKEGANYKITVEGEGENYVAIIDENGFPRKITRTSKGIVNEMVYETVEPLKEDFEKVASRYRINFQVESVNLPLEIKKVLESVSWYTVSRLKIGDQQVVMIIANHKSGAIVKAVYSPSEVNVNVEPNEKIIIRKGEGYYVYLITQDEKTYNEILSTLSSIE
ncbi:hypothetical protein [Pseudothermotoga thermarum]|uniref:DUF4340 domain-containing protein n=1 Tax=Pseudothermotoga thermarum DSM 5069 TaxID=688269 RepID=F7YX61_9THEM|nr:hypothetical protein [Pseudothermotoga thermarum]AEH51000.1 hypothetical protein Theth_0916 [Pseudothermotoga thermarum DSM 5069]